MCLACVIIRRIQKLKPVGFIPLSIDNAYTKFFSHSFNALKFSIYLATSGNNNFPIRIYEIIIDLTLANRAY